MGALSFPKPGRWRRERPNSHTETFASREYNLEIVRPADVDWAEAERQLRHAREQQALANAYPGRSPRRSP